MNQMSLRDREARQHRDCRGGVRLIVPVYEEIMVSPVTSVIMEACVREGDVVGSRDSASCARHIQRARGIRETFGRTIDQDFRGGTRDGSGRVPARESRMKIKSKGDPDGRLRVERWRTNGNSTASGGGTGDRIRQAELAWRISRLELDQLRSQLDNLRKTHRASAEGRNLGRSILDKNLAQMRRTLDNARVTAPRRGTVTYLNTKIGSTVSQGEKIAVISDLSRFRIEGRCLRQMPTN